MASTSFIPIYHKHLKFLKNLYPVKTYEREVVNFALIECMPSFLSPLFETLNVLRFKEMHLTLVYNIQIVMYNTAKYCTNFS